MIIGIDHLEFCVADIDAAAEFFKKMGFTEVRRTSHHNGAVELRMPGEQGVIFEFHYGKDTEAPGLNHIAFKVDNIQETYERFCDNGIVFVAQPKYSETRECNICNTRDPAHMRYQFTD